VLHWLGNIVLGLGHPMTVDRDLPMNITRRISAWLTVLLFVATFSPVPLAFSSNDDQQQQPEPQSTQVHEIVHHPDIHHQMHERLTHPRI
jgi:hypothetical protein